jgi:hypothetical protein
MALLTHPAKEAQVFRETKNNINTGYINTEEGHKK